MSTENLTGLGGLPQTMDDYSTMEFVARQVMNGMATSTPVKVVAVEGNTVDVQPLVNQIDGAGTGTEHSTIHNLPWHAIRAGACVIRISPRVGDIGHVVFCHNDISTVKKTRDVANPSSRRRYDWADGIYYGGILPAGEATTIIEIDADNNVSIIGPALNVTVSDAVNIAGVTNITGATTVTGDTVIDGAVNTTQVYKVGGTQVVGQQQTAIAGPTGGTTTDDRARAVINDILAAMQAHGLIA